MAVFTHGKIISYDLSRGTHRTISDLPVPDFAFPDGDEPVWVFVGQRPQQYGVHDAEQGSVGADAESECQNHNSREDTFLYKHAEAVAEILQKSVND